MSKSKSLSVGHDIWNAKSFLFKINSLEFSFLRGLSKLYHLAGFPNLETRGTGDIRIAKFFFNNYHALFETHRISKMQMRVTFSLPLTRPSVQKIV